jgi:hypothetical protein
VLEREDIERLVERYLGADDGDGGRFERLPEEEPGLARLAASEGLEREPASD